MFALYDGHIINPANIKPEDITLERIAHHLSGIQRFGGSLPLHCTYSVAEHCINLATAFDDNMQVRYALMHDAAEAFIGDIVTGLKCHLSEYKEIEARLEKMIYKKYRILKFKMVDYADKQIVLDEVANIMPERLETFSTCVTGEMVGCDIYFNMKKDKIKRMFLSMCETFNIRD